MMHNNQKCHGAIAAKRLKLLLWNCYNTMAMVLGPHHKISGRGQIEPKSRPLDDKKAVKDRTRHQPNVDEAPVA